MSRLILVLMIVGTLIGFASSQDQEKLKEVAGQKTKSHNNLKYIALGLIIYQEAKSSLPARASFDKKGAPLLSWRVHILPFLEQENLYKQFKLDEPWDGPNNKKLIEKIPQIYTSPFSEVGKNGKTPYLAITGQGSMFDGKKGVSWKDVDDGTSRTIMVAEANDKKAVFWTQPEDFPIDTKEPLPFLVNRDLKGFLTAFADGSVHCLSDSIPLVVFRGLCTRSGGEDVDSDPYER